MRGGRIASRGRAGGRVMPVVVPDPIRGDTAARPV